MLWLSEKGSIVSVVQRKLKTWGESLVQEWTGTTSTQLTQIFTHPQRQVSPNIMTQMSVNQYDLLIKIRPKDNKKNDKRYRFIFFEI